MATVNTTTTAVDIPEQWAAKVLMATESNLVFANLVDRYDADVSSAGDIVHITNIGEIPASNVTQGTAVTMTANTETSSTITVDQNKAAGVEISDMARIQANAALVNKYTDKIGYALAKAVDTSISALVNGLSTEVDAGTSITLANVTEAIQTLDLADAPATDRAWVVDPRTHAALKQVAEFTRYDATGAKGTAAGGNNGMVGNLFNIPVHMSTNVTVAAGTPDVVQNVLMHKEAFGLAMQKSPTIESDRNVQKLTTDVVGNVLYGVAELRDSFGVRFEFDY